MEDADFKATKAAFMEFVEDDYTFLSLAVSLVKDRLPDASDDEVRQITLRYLKELLQENRICAGMFLTRDDFSEWRLDPQTTVERIAREWDKLGREPKIGEVVWFDTVEDE